MNTSFTLNNSADVAVPYSAFTIPAQHLKLTGVYHHPARAHLAWNTTLKKTDGSTLPAHGHIDYENSLLHYSSSVHEYDLHGTVNLRDLSANIMHNDHHLGTVQKTEKPHGVKGTTSVAALRTLLNKILSYDLQGEGDIPFQAWYEGTCIKLQLSLDNAAIRLPHTYNHLTKLQLSCMYDPIAERITITDCQGSLYKGHFSGAPSTFMLSPSYDIWYWHVPIMLDNCLITMQRGIFAMLSGTLLSEKRMGHLPIIRGHLILDRAQISEQLLSAEWLQSLIKSLPQTMHTSSPDVALDISVETKESIRVKTEMVQTHATVHLHIGGTILQPQVSGTIEMHGGSFALPYKPLYLSKATLTFHPHTIKDPSIELVAKNLIKKHNITLQISGSLQHPQIMLQSSPPLTEEQIISLLVSGSHEDTLRTAIPALIIKSLKDLLFTRENATPVAENFNRLLKPLKLVQIVPHFSDQMGRGGLRGALEIDVTDRLSVLLQKNFSLSEDTRLEVEYLLSDDISLRGVRDERKDVTGEVEMKWKF